LSHASNFSAAAVKDAIVGGVTGNNVAVVVVGGFKILVVGAA
jgi:hypothetical protein